MSISGVSGASLSSAAGIEQMIRATMAAERQPVTRLESQKSDLEVKRAIYADIKTKMTALKTVIQDLKGDDGVLNKYKATVKNSDDETVLSASVSSSSTVASGVYNVTVNRLAQADRYIGAKKSDSTSALNLTGSLTINGQSIAIDVNDSLDKIRDAINEYDFEGAEVEAVKATIVDNRLVLTSVNTGSDAAITVDESGLSGGSLGLARDTSLGLGDPADTALLNASLKVNGVDITRQKNTDLDDIVKGLTFDLTAEGSTSVTVAKSNNDAVTKVNAFIEAYNNLVKHLKLKTEPQLDEKATGKNPTYTPAPLGRDLTMRTLRINFSYDLLSLYGDAAKGSPNDITDLGIEVSDDNFTFSLADSSKLTDALDGDFESVAAMLNNTLGKMENRIDKFLDGDTALLPSTQDAIDKQIDEIDERIEGYEDRLSVREEALRKQYYQLQSQLITMQYDFQSTQAAMYGSMNLLNQTG
ncbi:MAG TPA: flagellar filament capping protein FliD [Anaerolineae bacterium]|nr:flagellar filament capping protein FliD [Anaerolineae bacterium]